MLRTECVVRVVSSRSFQNCGAGSPLPGFFFLVCILLSQSSTLNNFFQEEIPSFAPTGPPLYAGYHPNFGHYTLPVTPSHVPSTQPPRAPFIPYTPNSNAFQLLSSNSNPSANPPALDLPSSVPSSPVHCLRQLLRLLVNNPTDLITFPRQLQFHCKYKMLRLQLQLGTRETRVKQKEVKRLIEVELEEEGVQLIMLEAKLSHQMR